MNTQSGYPWQRGTRGDRPWLDLSKAEQEMVRRGHWIPGMWRRPSGLSVEQEIEELYPVGDAP